MMYLCEPGQNLVKKIECRPPKDVSVCQFGWFKKTECRPLVTLKIRSRSPKSNLVLPMMYL